MLQTLIEVTYSYAYSLYLFFRTAWPLSLVYGPPLHPPSTHSRKEVGRAINQLKDGDGSGDSFGSGVGSIDGSNVGSSAGSIVSGLPKDEDLLSVVDPCDGFDLLQHAVIAARKDLVLQLVQRQGTCCVGRYHCSSPLHLAAYLGHVGILRWLLSGREADPGMRRGMCYPEPHLPVGSKVAYFGFSHHHLYRCSRADRTLTPMQVAIQQRQLGCVEALTDALIRRTEGRGQTFSALEHLQFACKEGAAQCIRYFVDRFPECINSYGPDGDTPLLTAVPWGEECVKVLVNSGADVHQLSQNIGETALHRLYRMNMDGLFTIHDTTRYLLTTGIEQDINALTALGETPLHMLVSHVSYAGGNYVDPSQHGRMRALLQPDYQAQVLLAIQAVLQFNADPLMLNGQGLQPLSRLLHIALKACRPSDPCPCVRSSQPDCFIVDYSNDYRVLRHAADLLLQHQAPVDFACSSGHTPFILLLHCFLFDDVRSLMRQSQHALAAAELFVKGGANVNFTDVQQGTTATLLAMICRRCFTERFLRVNPDLQVSFAKFCDDLLTLALRGGLEPNHRTSKSPPSPAVGRAMR